MTLQSFFSIILFIFASYLSINSCSTQIIFQITPKAVIRIKKGDITEERVDAIVNAANEQLQGGDGVCGAIFRAAGWEKLQEACNEHPIIAGKDIRCPVASTRITESFNLFLQSVKKIIHAVGPDCRKITDEQEQNRLLIRTYQSLLQTAEENQMTSIAIPFISSAIYAFDKVRASSIALETTIEAVKNNPNTCLRDIRFILFSDHDYELFVLKANQITHN